ncbi:hypothetical protein JCM14713_02510 [Desulfomicrobium salsuginis]
MTNASGLTLVLEPVTVPANLNDMGMVQKPGSSVADVSAVLLPKASSHSSKLRFDVRMTESDSYRLAMTWKNRFV